MKAIGNLLGYLVIDHLHHIYMFANDVLLFAKVSNSQEMIISDILIRFAMFSDLKVNVAKSNVFFSTTTKNE